MRIDFKPSENTAVDARSGIIISYPRVLPSPRPDGSEGVEYQYTFRRGRERFAALGFLGSEQFIEEDGRHVSVRTLDLTPHQVVSSILDIGMQLDPAAEAFNLVRCIAEGLVNVFAAQVDNRDSLHYIAFTHADTLEALGVSLPKASMVRADGVAILAELFVPAHVV